MHFFFIYLSFLLINYQKTNVCLTRREARPGVCHGSLRRSGLRVRGAGGGWASFVFDLSDNRSIDLLDMMKHLFNY